MKRPLCLGGLALVIAATPAAAADLSPANWPREARARLEQDQLAYGPAVAGDVSGRSMLVAGTASPVAVHAGVEALRLGGTAADAAATVALTQIATDFGQTVTYAGKLALVYFDAKTRKVSVLDAPWASYAGETDPKTIPEVDLSGIGGAAAPAPQSAAIGRQTLVPGFMAGLGAVHARFGRVPWTDLFQPAIWYAEHGVTVSPARAGGFQSFRSRFERTPEGRRFASMPDGSVPKAGDVLRQPDLAQTLRRVAAEGPGYMYTGDWAKAFVEAVDAKGGKAALDDLARYRPAWLEPIVFRFAGADIYGMGQSSLGCSSLVALNLLAAMHVDQMGPYWRDPVALKAYTRAIRYATWRQYARPALALERDKGLDGSSCEARLQPAYARALAPGLMMATPPWPHPFEAAPNMGHHTQAVVAIDQWGDIAVLVHTSNGSPTGIVVGGVTVSEAGAVNKSKVVDLKPGNQVPQDLAPFLAVRDGKPVMAIGAIGSSLGPETVRLLGEVLTDHADLKTALAAPPLLDIFHLPAPDQTVWTMPQPVPKHAYDAAFLSRLAAEGVPTQEEAPLHVLADLRGEAIVAVINQRTGAPASAEIRLQDAFVETDLQMGVHPIETQ